MDYYNFLTTPTGRYCEVKEILNKDYLVLVKFIDSENYKAFFEALNEIVLTNIPDFEEFNIIEKCYVYMAMCMYSVKATLDVVNPKIGSQMVPLATVINNVESSYQEKTFDYQLREGATLTIGYPKTFEIEDNFPVIDWFSGIQSLNGKSLSKEQIKMLKNTVRAKDILSIEDIAREKFRQECDLFSGVPMNELKITLCSESLILNSLFFFKYPLEGFYGEMYACCKHLKMSFRDFMERTHVETEMFLSFAKKENEETSKTDSTGLGRMSQMIQDES